MAQAGHPWRGNARRSFSALAALGLLGLPAGEAAAEAPVGPPEEVPPGIVIQPRPEARAQEYRARDRVFMIRIWPAKGPPYFLVDLDGDGRLETRRSDLDPEVLTPQWVVGRWRLR